MVPRTILFGPFIKCAHTGPTPMTTVQVALATHLNRVVASQCITLHPVSTGAITLRHLSSVVYTPNC